MELTILDYVGLPDGSILSVRSGPTRRQSPLPCSAPFRLPPGPWPLRIDVLGLLGKTNNHAVLGDILEDGVCKMPLEGKDGRQMSVTFQIRGSRSKVSGRSGNASPVKKRDAEADARAYLDAHRLHEFMHGLFELLLRERPEDPYAFMAKRFSQAAAMEGAALKISQSAASTATPSSASMMSSMSPSRDSLLAMESFGEVPEGSYKAIFQSMRGRDIARLVLRPDEKVGSIKSRLESATSAPVSAIQLFWLGEMLPNDTTLQDWFVEAGPVVLHVVLSHREPKLQYVLSGASEGGLRLWDPTNAEQVKELLLPVSSAILAMCVDWKTMRVLCATFDGRMQLWDISKETCINSIMAHSEEVCSLNVDWEKDQALSGSTDGSVKLWCLKAFRCTGITNTHVAVDSFSVEWSTKRAYIGLRNGVVRFWDLASPEVTTDFEGGATAAKEAATAVSGTAIDCVGRRAVSGFEDGHLAYWHFEEAQGDCAEISGQKSLKVVLAHFSALRSIVADWKERSSRALVGSDDGSLSLWRLDSSECLARFARHVGFVWAIHVDWAKERAVSGAFDGCLKIWDLRTGECLRTIQGHSRPIRSICCG